MTWFRVDDKFYSHEKVVQIPRGERAEAIGTWTLCGTWSAAHERDGFVPEHMLDELGATIAGAESLIRVHLWKRRRGGFVFVNWDEFQPTRAEKMEKRRSDSERQAAKRARDAAERAALSQRDTTGIQRSRPVPSRPEEEDQDSPTRPELRSDSPQDDAAVHSPVVESVIRACSKHCARDLHPLVVHEVVAWLDARRGPNPPPLQVPARYYGSAIARSAFEVQQMIDEKGLTA